MGGHGADTKRMDVVSIGVLKDYAFFIFFCRIRLYPGQSFLNWFVISLRL
jgi:hypothetical protein